MTRTASVMSLALLLCVTPACTEEVSSGAAAEETVKGTGGHSCQTDNDCAEGLACIDEVCDLVDFGLTDSANECKLVTCTVPSDCCATPNAACDAWKQACDLGESASCDNYNFYANNCVCNESLLECTDFQCVVNQCLTSTDCCQDEPPECAQLQANCDLGDTVSCALLDDPATGCCDPTAWTCTVNKTCSPACQDDLACIGYGVCDFGVCVECRDGDDCPSGETCSSGGGVSACATDSDCAAFHQCAAGECVESGCITDSECVALLKDVQAVCTETRCVLPCATDADCDEPSDFGFQVCFQGLCKVLGCQTDQECRLRYGVTPSSNYDALCVPAGS